MKAGKGIFLASLVGGIVYLAANGHDGWGWLVFIALVAM